MALFPQVHLINKRSGVFKGEQSWQTTRWANNAALNLVIAELSLTISSVSDATKIRLAFGGAVILKFALVSLVLLRTIVKDTNE